jgi:hypothetical protein
MIRLRYPVVCLAIMAGACSGDKARPSATQSADSEPQIHSVAPLLPGDTALSAPAPQKTTRPGGQATGTAAGSIVTKPSATLPAPGAQPRANPTVSTPTVAAVPTPSVPAQSQQPTMQPPASSGTAAPARDKLFARPVPFAPGEKFVYDVKFGALDVGDAVMEVTGVEDVRGRGTYHVRFNVKGGTFFYRVNDRYDSWIDTTSLVSLRHHQQIDEGHYERERKYEISPERGVYQENEKPEQPTVAEPLDDGSFFFFLRSIPLEVGQTYSFDRYFKPDRNPVTVTVVRRERIKVPAGTFDAIVLHPTIKAKGVFGEGGQAEIWLADDSTRAMLQMKSKLKIGSLNLYLKKLTRGVQPVVENP